MGATGMRVDIEARGRLQVALDEYAARWRVERHGFDSELENLLTVETPPAAGGWSALLSAQASDYLSAALYLDVDPRPDGFPTNSSGRLGEALRRWWKIRVRDLNYGGPRPATGVYLYLWATMPHPYEHEGVGGYPLTVEAADQLVRVVESVTPAAASTADPSSTSSKSTTSEG